MVWVLQKILLTMLPLGFTTNCSPFPRPLSYEEELECLRLAKLGNKDAKDKLVVHNQRLVVHVMKRFSQSALDSEDMFQIGLIGLIKGIEGYDHEKNVKLGTFCGHCIANEIMMELRKIKRIPNEISLFDPISSDKDGHDLLLEDTLEGDNADITENVMQDEMRAKIRSELNNHLNDREREIVEKRFGLNDDNIQMTQNQIADLLKISRSYVSRIEKKAIGILKTQMGHLREWF